MFCPQCRKRVDDTAKFCPFCGKLMPQGKKQVPSDKLKAASSASTDSTSCSPKSEANVKPSESMSSRSFATTGEYDPRE